MSRIGYSGPLPTGEHAGCNNCHVKGSDHYNGLAVDIVRLKGSGRCDRTWLPITRLAHWAEPTQNHPRAPFRWVGYDGDAGHGCGNHLHLSWNHAPAAEYRLAEWVEVFPGGGRAPGLGAPASAGNEPSPPLKPAREWPTGGVSQTETGGIPPRRD
jgi:hypothetical protein